MFVRSWGGMRARFGDGDRSLGCPWSGYGTGAIASRLWESGAHLRHVWRDGLLVVRLDHTATRNSLTDGAIARLAELVDVATTDPTVHGVSITGASPPMPTSSI